MTTTFDHKLFIDTLTTRPGVYQMFNARSQVLYVGKARNLKDRIASYFRTNQTDPKTIALLPHIHHITVTITHTENEALLLESHLIKTLRPRYNILLKDDKSYPFLFLSAHVHFPRLSIHRGSHNEKGEYFGPYPSSGAVRETLDLLQKLFKIRQCNDAFFKSRSRPCLQYQIKRCTAPCVGFIDPSHYQENVEHTRLFLLGKNESVMQQLMEKMEIASQQLAFEHASHYRDQIMRLRQIQERQYVYEQKIDMDVIAVASQEGVVCIELLFFRAGRLLGNKSYLPRAPAGATEEEVLAAFLPQYYLSPKRGSSLPTRVLINKSLLELKWIQAAINQQLQKKITIFHPLRGKSLQWLHMALINAKHTLVNHLSTQNHFYQGVEALQKELKLTNVPQRMECFDISHTQGEATVGSCVVFDSEGARPDQYRRFNVTGCAPGDDYAAMKHVLTRHYKQLKIQEAVMPDILFVDGGKGQLAKAQEVLEELQVTGVLLVGVAKGEGRKPGLEKLFLVNHSTPLDIAADSVALHLVQRIRDEAHRFAITGHRRKRAKIKITSSLEDIAGIGPKRRRDLLRHFGGLQGVTRASVTELSKVQGINADLAQRIYDGFHGE